MRIVHVADYYMPTLGYQENILPRYHARHGHDVHVITSDRYAPVPHYDASWLPLLGPRHVGARTDSIDGVTVHRLPGRLERRSRILIPGVWRALDQIRPDAIFGHGTSNYTAFQLARAAKKSGVPLFLDCHMLFTVQDTSPAGRAFYRGLRTATAAALTPHVTRYYGVAEEACDFLAIAQGIPRSKIESLPLGLDTEVFSPRPDAAAELRASLGLPDDAIVVMQTGKLTPDKGPDLLAGAVAPLMAHDQRVHLILVGGGSPDFMDKVRQPLLDAGVVGRLIQCPLVPADELAAYFSAADLVVFPAASSLSSIEAAGCGVAVVMTDLPAGRWRAEHGVGVTFSDGDPAALRDLLSGLIEDPERRHKLGQEARESVLREFSYERISLDLEAAMAQAAIGR